MYSERYSLETKFASEKPLAAVELKDGTIGFLLRQPRTTENGDMVVAEIDFNQSFTMNSMQYFKVSLSEAVIPWNRKEIKRTLLLLPLLTGPVTYSIYSFLNSTWESLCSDGSFHLPPQLDPIPDV